MVERFLIRLGGHWFNATTLTHAWVDETDEVVTLRLVDGEVLVFVGADYAIVMRWLMQVSTDLHTLVHLLSGADVSPSQD